MAIQKVAGPVLTTSKKLGELLAPKDAGATAAMKELAKNNTKNGSVSGQEMADAIEKGTKDVDNQAAGKEFAVIKKYVDANGPKLSPEAKKVYEVYKKQVELSKANGQTGIEPRAYASMTKAMQAAAKPAAKDVSSGEAMKELLKNNPKDGSISGEEFTRAVVKGTQDKDNSAAGKEFKDVQKFVKENEKKLSPEAKKAFAVYEKAAREAQAKGQTGIDQNSYNKMVRDMAKAGAPTAQDKSMGDALKDLKSQNTRPGSISAKELAETVNKGARDLDSQSAGKEFKDLQKFVKENEQLLSPDAKKAYAMYEKAALEANKKGSTSIGTLEQFNKLTADMAKVGEKPAPAKPDASTAAALKELAAGNKGPGSISGSELATTIANATKDPDNQAAGQEFKQIADFVKKNEKMLSPEAKKAFAVYEKAAKEAQAKGDTGIPTPIFDKMVKEMEKAGAPVFKDASMADSLKDLAKNNKTPGSISAEDLANALKTGAKDLDNQSAGKEFQDMAKFVKENAQLLSPGAREAFAMYEKAAKEARSKGETGMPLEKFNKLVVDMGLVGHKADAGAAKSLKELGATNQGPGSISGNELAAAIKNATKDTDGQAAGQEYKQIADFVKKNEAKLSPEAKKAFAVYEKAVKEAQGKGETGIPTPIFDKMVKEMEKAGQPVYQDASMGKELNKLANANKAPGSISAQDLADAMKAGARDLDGGSATKEFQDLQKFVRENAQLLSPQARQAFELYSKAANEALAKGQTGMSLEKFDATIKEMGNIGKAGNNAIADAIENAMNAAGLKPPQFPGLDASPAELAKFQLDMQKFFDALQAQINGGGKPGTTGGTAPSTGTTTPAPAPSTGGSAPAPSTSTPAPSQSGPVRGGGDISDQAIRAIGALKEPAIPGPDASPQELAQYEKDTKKYDRMMELMSSIIKKRDELQMSIIRKM